MSLKEKWIMMIDDQRRRFSAFWKESEKVIGTILEKVFHSKLSLTPQISKEISIQNNWQNESFPKVVVSFRVVGAPISQHIFYFEPDTALYLFGTMIDSDPDLELTEEHLEGLKEACNQIWGQLQLVMEDWKDFQLDQLEVLKVETPQDLEISQNEGIIIKYQVVSDKGKKFAVYHYCWDQELRQQTASGKGQNSEVQNIYPVEFQEISGGPTPGREARNIDMLMDVELDVYVELGRKTLMIKDVLKLGKGSIIELDKAAGEPLSVFINGRKFAEGEVVVVDDQFGVRLTQLINPRERIKSLA
jgi:flagellar motor switch protein FliN